MPKAVKAKKEAAPKTAKRTKKAAAAAPKKEKKTAKTAAKKAAAAPEAPQQAPSAEKLEIISKFQVKEGDTGSPEVQVALLTKRIEKLVTHLKANPSDNHSRRGLLGIVSKRRRLLNYLEKKNAERYTSITGKLGLSK